MNIFFYRFVMVVRKNVLEYIIALVVVKNKVRLKKCLKKFQIWQSSIVQINLSITFLRLIPKFRPVFDDQCFFTRNTPKMFAPPSARRNFFKCTPPTWNPGSTPGKVFQKHVMSTNLDNYVFIRSDGTKISDLIYSENHMKTAQKCYH